MTETAFFVATVLLAILVPSGVALATAWWSHRSAQRMADLARACLASGRFLPISADRQPDRMPVPVREEPQEIRNRAAELKLRDTDTEPPSETYG